MRKIATTFLIAALCLCAFVSCNIDATEGIYSEVASSTVNTDVNIKAYLGMFNDQHYYLSDEGIFRIGSDDALLENSNSSIIRSASLDNATGNALVMSQKSDLTTVLDYYTSLDADPTQVAGSFKALLRNGLVYDDSKIYKVTSGTAIEVLTGVNVRYALETGDFAFFSVIKDSEAKFYVIKNDGTVVVDGVEGNASTYIAFQPVGDSGKFVLVRYNSSKATFEAYELTSAGVATTVLFTMKSSLHYAYSTQAASFYYTADAKEYIVIKASNYFDRYNITDNTIESISTGFATNLRTAGIVNIEDTSDPLVFIAGTYDSMLYEINMTNNKSTQIR